MLRPALFPLKQCCCLWLLFSFNIDVRGQGGGRSFDYSFEKPDVSFGQDYSLAVNQVKLWFITFSQYLKLSLAFSFWSNYKEKDIRSLTAANRIKIFKLGNIYWTVTNKQTENANFGNLQANTRNNLYKPSSSLIYHLMLLNGTLWNVRENNIINSRDIIYK